MHHHHPHSAHGHNPCEERAAPGHSHDHHGGDTGGHDHGHSHDYRSVEKSKLILSLVITVIVMVVEVVGGILSNSIALVSDAAHMFTHAFALGVSLVAIYLASSAPGHRRTFGLFRAEVLASLFNSLFLFAVTALIVYESMMRFLDPTPVHSREMFFIAIIGLIVNLVSMWILRSADKGDRNIRSAIAHMAADALSSVAVVAGAIIIRTTGFTYVDPALGIGISVLILLWGWNLLKDAVRVLLEIAPAGMNTDRIKRLLRENDPRIVDVPDMHVIEITSGMYDLTAHVAVRPACLPESQDIIDKINHLLSARLNIYHTTIQVGESVAD